MGKIELLSLPANAFLEDEAPYSLILNVADLHQFRVLYRKVSTSHADYGENGDYYHFSPIHCRNKLFREKEVLTVNMETGKWCWRKPFKDPYP